MECEQAQVLLVAYVLGELDAESVQYHQLEAHLGSCPACRRECEDNRWAVDFIEQHKVLFGEALESLEKRGPADQGQPARSLQDTSARPVGNRAKRTSASWLVAPWRVAAVAACVAIGIVVWLAIMWNSGTSGGPSPGPIASAAAPSVRIEQLSDAGILTIAAGTQIRTAAEELKTLIINGKHRVVINCDTTLSIDPYTDGDRPGCVARLVSGEIYAHVEHDGNPFVVSTAHGRAVITGTSFNVRATEAATTLVVAEGTVRFGSKVGVVEVTAGRQSRLGAGSAPSEPAVCNAAELTSWATSHQIKTALAKVSPCSEARELMDLWVTAISGPIDLDSINYEVWVEEKRDWFRREFPQVFRLRWALGKEGVEADYPELLVRSGDIRQFAYPEGAAGTIAVVKPESLIEAAGHYGFDRQWSLENMPEIGSSMADSAAQEGGSGDLGGFEKWGNSLERAVYGPKGLDSATLLHSVYAAAYLSNTRTLLWLCIGKGKYDLDLQDETALLSLLDRQVGLANELVGKTIQLAGTGHNQSCGGYEVLIGSLVDIVDEIASIERSIRQYDLHE